MTCEFCDEEKTRVVFVGICNSDECEAKAREGKVSLGISRTKFGRAA